MTLFHNTTLRRWMAIGFLITSLITQVQWVYACELMDNGPQTTCCCDDQENEGCPMGGGCGSDEKPSDNCCAVSLALPPESSLSNIESATPRDAVSHNIVYPAPVLITSLTQPFNTKAPRLLFNHVNTPWYAGTDTYLLTLRFRE